MSVKDQRRRSAADSDRSDAIQELFENYVVELYQHVHRRCGDDRLSEDVVQDVFVEVARSGHDPREVTIAWLKTVARNKLVDQLRRRENYGRKLRLLHDTSPDAGAEDQIVDVLVVSEAIDSLRPVHRMVLMLHYIDGLTVSELADELDRSVKGAESLITRARNALRSELEIRDA